MLDSCSRMPSGALRRLVLGAAFAAGLAAALVPHTQVVRAADLPRVLAQTAAPKDNANAPENPAAPKAAPAAPTPPPAATSPGKDADTDTESESDADTSDPEEADAAGKSGSSHGAEIIIQKGNKHVRIQGFGRDRQYDSFEQFVQQAPWLAGLVFLTVLLVFLVPLLIVVLLIWYKVRKNRLANETILKLAERGVVPPATAMDAVATGTAASLAAAAAAPGDAGTAPSTPAYEQARLLHRRVAWSDLRKGVILSGVGIGLTAWSMLDDGTPNGIGLVFLFVGLGYCLLWFFEDRPRHRDASGSPPAGGV